MFSKNKKGFELFALVVSVGMICMFISLWVGKISEGTLKDMLVIFFKQLHEHEAMGILLITIYLIYKLLCLLFKILIRP
jgi:hypothetical protein